MKPNTSSRTAEYNALFRAIETRRPSDQRLFHDDMARRFLSLPLAAVELGCSISLVRRGVTAFIDRRWPGIRTSVAARTLLIDRLFVELASDVEQIVLLGAGFDTRASRLSQLEGRIVFEVDHESTQSRKRTILNDAAPTIRYVPSDFTVQNLDRDLEDAGFSTNAPTLILWEGVSNYLTAEAVSATLNWCAAAAPGSHLVFTYIDEQAISHPENYRGSDRLRASLERAGEPLAFGISPDNTRDYLSDHRLELLCDHGAAEYRTRAYGQSAAERMVGHEFYRVAHARPRAGITR